MEEQMRRSIAIVAGAGLFLLASGAQAGVVLYGWNGSADGWTGLSGNTTTVGVTEGTGAATFDGKATLVSPTDTSTILAALTGGAKLSIDAIMVNAATSDFQNWNFSFKIGGKNHLGSNFETAATLVADETTGTYVVSGLHTNRVGTAQATLVYDYSAIAGGDLTAGTAQSVYFKFSTSSAGGSTWPDSTNDDLVMDNLQVLGAVPEPASMGLLAAGGLMLLSRRRRAV
jgi:hypothetical protein